MRGFQIWRPQRGGGIRRIGQLKSNFKGEGSLIHLNTAHFDFSMLEKKERFHFARLQYRFHRADINISLYFFLTKLEIRTRQKEEEEKYRTDEILCRMSFVLLSIIFSCSAKNAN